VCVPTVVVVLAFVAQYREQIRHCFSLSERSMRMYGHCDCFLPVIESYFLALLPHFKSPVVPMVVDPGLEAFIIDWLVPAPQ